MLCCEKSSDVTAILQIVVLKGLKVKKEDLKSKSLKNVNVPEVTIPILLTSCARNSRSLWSSFILNFL